MRNNEAEVGINIIGILQIISAVLRAVSPITPVSLSLCTHSLLMEHEGFL